MRGTVTASAPEPFVMRYNPHQTAFLEALDARTAGGKRTYNMLGVLAGRQSGKSMIGGLASAKLSSPPGTVGWACAPSYPELHDYVVPAITRAIPRAWIAGWSQQNYEFTLTNGSIIRCRSLDDPERGRGGTLDWLWFDEGCKIQERAFEIILPALAVKDGVFIVTTSVNGFDWVYRRIWKPAQDGVPGYWAIKYKSADNPVMSADILAATRRGMSEAFARQELDAEFVSFTGAVYGESVTPQVVAAGEEARVIPEWPAIRGDRQALVGIDPGTDHPFGATLAVLTEHGLVVCGEYLERHRALVDHAAGLRALTRPFSQVQYAIDRSAPQITIELAQHGIYAIPAENAVEAGIRRVESWLTSGRMWFLESRVPKTIEQMRAYRWAENTGRDGLKRTERVFKVQDELPDCLRYMAMTWPELPEVAAVSTGRSIESVPEASRWAWAREQRLTQPMPDVALGMGEMYGD